MSVDTILNIKPERFFTTPLDQPLLGEELSIDVYLHCGFRYLGLPASIQTQKLETSIQKFRNRSKLSLQNVIDSAISIGYESFISHDDCLNHVIRLQEPKYRIIQELFWLHLEGELFDPNHKIRSITDEKIDSFLVSDTQPDNATEFLNHHALAVVNHNKAMLNELMFVCEGKELVQEYWQMALNYWYKTWSSEYFWNYMQERIRVLDDPRIQAEDVELLRTQLPKVILGFHVFWAKMYTSVQREEDSLRHIELLTQSPFSNEIKQESLIALVEVILQSRLVPLVDEFELELTKFNHFDWPQHAQLCEDVLDKVNSIYMYLKGLNFSSELIDNSGFDHFCTTLIDSLENKLDYSNDKKERNLLYSSLIIKKLKKLPMSASLNRKLDAFFDKDINYLYGSFLNSEQQKEIDHTRCWFSASEPADPDSSILVPVYKITQIKSKFVNWTGKSILIPRSKLAAKIHHGEKKFRELVRIANDDRSQSVLTQIRQIEDKFKNKIEECNQQYEKEYDNIQLQEAKDLEEHDSTVENENDEIMRKLSSVDEAEQFKISLQKNANEAELVRVETKQENVINKIKQENEKILAAVTFVSHLKTSLPFAVMLIIAGVLFKNNRQINLPAEQGLDGSTAGGIYYVFSVLHLDLFLLGVLGFFTSAFLRSRIIKRNAERREKKAIFHKNKKVNELKQYHQGLVAEIIQDFEKTRLPLEVQLNELDHKRHLIQDYYDRMKQKCESANEKEVQIIEEKMVNQVNLLTDKIKNYFNVKPKGYMKKFLPYKNAFKNGFIEGERPSQKELKRLAS